MTLTTRTLVRDPFKDTTAKQALVAIAMIFVLGLVIGFALGKTV